MRTRPSGVSGYVSSGDIRLHYLEYGSGCPVVLVPGITSPAVTWEFVADELAANYRLLLMDVRGRGLSDHPIAGFELADYAADVAALVHELGLERPAVIGHSMGARIAAAYGVFHPDLAGPLVLVDPPLTGPGRGEYPTSLDAFMQQLADAKAGATIEDARPFFPTWSDEQLRLRVEWLPTCDEVAVRETWFNFHREDVHALFGQLEPPVLFMYGLESPVVTAEGVEEVRALNPRLEYVGIDHAGHMIPWDNLADFLTETRRFLASAQ
jgi:N-formylmaleamate deformylase